MRKRFQIKATNPVLASLCLVTILSYSQDLPDIGEIRITPTSMVCEFSPTDPKGDFFLMKEYDERHFGRPGEFLATYKISPLVRTAGSARQLSDDDQTILKNINVQMTALGRERKNGEFVFTGQRKNYEDLSRWKTAILEKRQPMMNLQLGNSQAQEMLKVIVPHNSADQNVDPDSDLKDLRAIAPLDFGDLLDSFPCESKNIRICAKAEPFTEHATDKENEIMKEKDVKKLYRRISVLRIEHCLSDYPMSSTDKETLRKACEEWPNKNEKGNRIYIPDNDAGYLGFHFQLMACRDAVNAFLDKQKNLPRNERGKYVPKEHK